MVVIHREIEEAYRLAKDILGRRKKRRCGRSCIALLLSVRHAMLCRVDQQGRLQHTAPAVLLNGVDAPSPAAMSLLVQAYLHGKRPPPRIFTHRIPIEIQDRIMEFVSENPTTAARLECTLRLGSPFAWRRRDGV